MPEEFWEDYDSFAQNVMNANYKFISNALRRWLALLDGTSASAALISALEKTMDFALWYADAESTQGGMVGSGQLDLPLETEKRLGAYLFLLRKAAQMIMRQLR